MTPRLTAAPGVGGPGLDHDQPGFYAPALGPFANQVAGALVATRAYALRVVCPKSQTISKIGFVVATGATADDPCDVGIFNAGGTVLLGSSGSTLGRLNSVGVKTVNLQTPVLLTQGVVYYAAFVCGAIGGTSATLVLATVSQGVLPLMFGLIPAVELGIQQPLFPLAAPFVPTGTPNTAPIMALQQ